MSKAIGLALLAVGIVPVVIWIMKADSVASDISRFFTGEPTDRTPLSRNSAERPEAV